MDKALRFKPPFYYPMQGIDEGVIKSTIYLCSIEGTDCLHRFLKTREDQPDICANCLKQFGVLYIYKPLYVIHSRRSRKGGWLITEAK